MEFSGDFGESTVGLEGSREAASAGQAHELEADGAPALGRYIAVDIIGMGGMGVVYRAHDPQLDRDVAVKVVRRERLGEGGEARLLREARAMARVTHPNVVTVFDVMPCDEGLVFVMELVEGTDLRGWLVGSKSAPDAVLDAFVAAGRGLAAVHDAGMTHRDFKPANVLIAHDGRIMVTDFGLALGRGPQDTMSSGPIGIGAVDADVNDSLGGAVASESLTETGLVMGTPAYMAPEQLQGAATEPASDQYAFCVALWEGLCGRRPFDGRVKRVSARKVVPPWPAPPGVPLAVGRVIRRGLSASIEGRFESMPALLEALSRARGQRRARWVGLVGATLVVGAATGWALQTDPATGCRAGTQPIQAVWDQTRATAVEAGFARVDPILGPDIGGHIHRALDDYVQDWTATQAAACAVAAASEQSRGDRERQLECLADRRRALAGVIAVLASADTGVVRRAVGLVARLPDVRRCGDVEVLRVGVAPLADEAVAGQVDSLRLTLSTVDALADAAHYDEALTELGDSVGRAETVGFAPVLAEALFARARISRAKSAPEASVVDLQRAVEVAVEARADAVAAKAAALLAFVLASDLHRAAEALPYGRQALSLAQRVDPDGQIEATAHSSLGTAYAVGSDPESAEEHFTRSIAISERLGNRLGAATTREGLAALHVERGEFDTAIALIEANVAVQGELLPSMHPNRATAINNLGAVHGKAGRFERAETLMREAYEIRLGAHGPEHGDVASSLANLGNVASAQRRYADAEVLHRKALDVFERVLGPSHARVALALNALASDLDSQGDYEQAAALMRRSLELRLELYGPDHPRVALLHTNLAKTLSAMEHFEEADRHEAAALDIYERTKGADSPDLAKALISAGQRALERGQADVAKVKLGRARVIFEARREAYPVQLAAVLYNLGKVELALLRPDEALALHEEALALRVTVLGDEHRDVMHARRRVADLLFDAGQRERAQQLYEAAWRHVERDDGVKAHVAEHIRSRLEQTGGSP